MSSYLIPPKAILAAQTFLPSQLVADEAFDNWLVQNNYDFVTQFHTAFRSGAAMFTYTYTGSSNVFAQNTLESLKSTLTSNTYGYTVTDPVYVSNHTYSITITMPV